MPGQTPGIDWKLGQGLWNRHSLCREFLLQHTLQVVGGGAQIAEHSAAVIQLVTACFGLVLQCASLEHRAKAGSLKGACHATPPFDRVRSEEHTSELQSL